MSTRSRIGIQLHGNGILSAYHHYDGYPIWLGRILKTHYNTKEKVAELIDGGDMSSCWTKERWDSKIQVKEYGPQYYSQRGEDCPPSIMTFDEYLNKENNEEYAYIFTLDGEWVCYDMHGFNDDKSPEVVEIPSGALAV